MSGLANIRAKVECLGLGGVMVNLGSGSVDAQPPKKVNDHDLMISVLPYPSQPSAHSYHFTGSTS